MIKKRGKKAQQVFGMSFSMILSILLIAVFIAVAFFAIRHFLEIKKCAEIGTFLEDFQDEIDRAWKSQTTEFVFKRTLPSKIQYVCFADLNKEQKGNIKDKNGESIYTELSKNAIYDHNLFFYPRRGVGDCLASTKILHINITGLTNPYCIEIFNKGINIQIKKDFFDALVKVSRTE